MLKRADVRARPLALPASAQFDGQASYVGFRGRVIERADTAVLLSHLVRYEPLANANPNRNRQARKHVGPEW